ncbi:hypothetical protein TUM12151_27580 [Morganella morganii]|nr:hypothetical protein TUM12149_15050 [Morganella morganii]GIZ31465.1 hypothetical protein TUM12150_19510 [Morganella morganii]GIZ35772.1 hypothetical protein TUM12151_27580 [Morganella morganii]
MQDYTDSPAKRKDRSAIREYSITRRILNAVFQPEDNSPKLIPKRDFPAVFSHPDSLYSGLNPAPDGLTAPVDKNPENCVKG